MSDSVQVLLFASAREAVGRASVVRAVPPGGEGLSEFLDELGATYPRLREVLRISRIVRNGELVTRRAGRVAPGDEIAVHPPYSGG